MAGKGAKKILTEKRAFKCEACHYSFHTMEKFEIHKIAKCSLRLISCGVETCNAKYTLTKKTEHFKSKHPGLSHRDFEFKNVRPTAEEDSNLLAKMKRIWVPEEGLFFRFGYCGILDEEVGSANYLFEWITPDQIRPPGSKTRAGTAWTIDRFIAKRFQLAVDDWLKAKKVMRSEGTPCHASHQCSWEYRQSDTKEKMDNMLSTNCSLVYEAVNTEAVKTIEKRFKTKLKSGDFEVGVVNGSFSKARPRLIECTMGRLIPLHEYVFKLMFFYCKKTKKWSYDCFIVPNLPTSSAKIRLYRKPLAELNKSTVRSFGSAIPDVERIDITTEQDEPEESEPEMKTEQKKDKLAEVETIDSLKKKLDEVEKEKEYWKIRCLKAEANR